MEEKTEMRDEIVNLGDVEVEVEETATEVSDGEVEDEIPEDVAALVAEAEHRGYLRGRNERIEELMGEPGQLERNSSGAECGGEPEGVEILRHRRVSIWDL